MTVGRVTDEEIEAFKQVQQRRHPVRLLLDNCAGGYEPLNRDIDKVVRMAYARDRASVRETLVEATAECRRLHAQGADGQARRLARDTSFELAAVLGPHRPPPEDLSTLSPRELADRIRR